MAARDGPRTEDSGSSRVRVYSATAGREPDQLPPDAATQGRERVAARKSAGASLPPRQRPRMRRAGCGGGVGGWCACAVLLASERVSGVPLAEGCPRVVWPPARRSTVPTWPFPRRLVLGGSRDWAARREERVVCAERRGGPQCPSF